MSARARRASPVGGGLDPPPSHPGRRDRREARDRRGGTSAGNSRTRAERRPARSPRAVRGYAEFHLRVAMASIVGVSPETPLVRRSSSYRCSQGPQLELVAPVVRPPAFRRTVRQPVRPRAAASTRQLERTRRPHFIGLYPAGERLVDDGSARPPRARALTPAVSCLEGPAVARSAMRPRGAAVGDVDGAEEIDRRARPARGAPGPRPLRSPEFVPSAAISFGGERPPRRRRRAHPDRPGVANSIRAA
jgi:hypothetical protein